MSSAGHGAGAGQPQQRSSGGQASWQSGMVTGQGFLRARAAGLYISPRNSTRNTHSCAAVQDRWQQLPCELWIRDLESCELLGSCHPPLA